MKPWDLRMRLWIYDPIHICILLFWNVQQIQGTTVWTHSIDPSILSNIGFSWLVFDPGIVSAQNLVFGPTLSLQIGPMEKGNQGSTGCRNYFGCVLDNSDLQLESNTNKMMLAVF